MVERGADAGERWDRDANRADPEHASLGELVDIAIEDRGLRQSAFTVGLDRSRLLEVAESGLRTLGTVGDDERARIERAKRQILVAEDRLDYEGSRYLRLRARVALGAVLALPILISAGVLLSKFTVGVAFGVVATLAAVGLFVAGWLAFRWLPASSSKRRRRLQGEIKNHRTVCAKAEKDLESVLVEEAIKPALRTYVNSREENEYRTSLTLTEQEGLAELEDPRYAIPTMARHQLDDFIKEMPGGSIGLAGPRGVGKSTLIRSVCPTEEGGTESRFGLVAAAPVEFDPREFLLYLFAETCRAVVGSDGVAELRRAASNRAVPRSPLGALLPLGTMALGLLGVAAIIGAVLPLPHLSDVLVGVILILTAMIGTPVALRGHVEASASDEPFNLSKRSRLTGFPEELVEQAADRLQDIWYQQTFTTGWSGSLKAPIGEAGLQGSRELARLQMTLPDIVGEFRSLLSAIAQHRKVLIGIDELDKIESREDAYRFMNEMKVLFGVERCFFLLSVSEDAMSAFERRGLPFRDVFDSSFDDVVNVGFLSAKESVELIQRRVIGMPLPFIFLCHCVAGGLARDVIRVAREVVVSNPMGDEGWLLHEVCHSIVVVDYHAKIDASLVATRAMSGAEVEILRSWLQAMRGVEVSPDALLDVCRRSRQDLLGRFSSEARVEPGGSNGPPCALANELLTFVLYSATLMEFFDSRRSPTGYRDAFESGRLDQLARARQALAVHPRVAWECLEDFRNGDTPPFPAAMSSDT